VTRQARLPAVRNIKGERHVVVLIVICDECGNREVGWAWVHVPGVVGYEPEIEPPANLGSEDEVRKAHGSDADTVLDGDWGELKRRRGRLTGPATQRNIVAFLTDPERPDDSVRRGQLIAYCPRHGGVWTSDIIDANAVHDLKSTRRVRAYPQRTE
jgi:hypothetical protein